MAIVNEGPVWPQHVERQKPNVDDKMIALDHYDLRTSIQICTVNQ